MIALPYAAHAQDFSSGNPIPQPFIELFKSAESIGTSIEQSQVVQRAIQSVQGQGVNPTSVFNFLLEWGRRISDWVQSTLGVSVWEIVKAMGGFFIWLLEFVINLVRQVLSYIH